MFCTRCGSQQQDDAAYCSKCGSPLGSQKPQAGESVRAMAAESGEADTPRQPITSEDQRTQPPRPNSPPLAHQAKAARPDPGLWAYWPCWSWVLDHTSFIL